MVSSTWVTASESRQRQLFAVIAPIGSSIEVVSDDPMFGEAVVRDAIDVYVLGGEGKARCPINGRGWFRTSDLSRVKRALSH